MVRNRKAKARVPAKRRSPIEPTMRWVTVNELCTRWGCTRATLYAKHLPHMKTIMFGGRRRIDLSESDRTCGTLSDRPGTIGQARQSEAPPNP